MSKVAVIVNSCDAFNDCWEPFIHSMTKFWGDCTWPVYLISNFKEIECPQGFSFLKVGEDRKFASNLKYAIERVDAEYLIYLQEDYFLNKKVNQEALGKHIEYCIHNDIDYMRLGMPFIKGESVSGIYTKNKLADKYALCLQAAIWKRKTLHSLLFEGWSGWDFEYKIQQYAIRERMKINILGINEENKCLGINYVTGTAVRKGKWTLGGYEFLKNEGFEDIIHKRRKEGFCFFHLQETHGILRLPALAIVKIMKCFNWNF